MECIKFQNNNQTSQKITQMPESEDFTIKLGYIQESSDRLKDQIDGSGMSLGRKKGVRVSGKYLNQTDWDRGGPSIVHSYVDCSRPPSNPTMMSIAPHRTFVSPEKDFSRGEENPSREVSSHSRDSCTNMVVSKQTMDELKSILRETSLLSTREKEEGRQDKPYTYHHGARPDGKADEGNKQKTFTTFKPNSDGSSRGLKSSSFLQIGSGMDSSSSCRSDRVRLRASRQSEVQPPTYDSSNNLGQTQASETDDGKESYNMSGTQFFISTMEKVKQQIAKENIKFVRFEATDLHGVSRSKTVPVRFFHEKAVCGVPMPRSYLELTLSPNISEVDHASTENFSSDVILIPNLATFRVLPWAKQTARVICDPCTVTGIPLRTSPRLIAKQQLGQLQSLGFSLYSAFTYECCVLGAPDRVGPKTLMFPASTLLSNHDLPFYQQLVDGMYSMGADVDSFASASGPSQMEITLRPEFGITAADSAFTFRTGIKEMARKHSYIASFFNDEDFHNAGVLSHSLWDANGHRSLFQTGEKQGDLSEIGRKWLAGLLIHSAALSCLMSPGVSCRSHIAKKVKDPKHTTLYATFGWNDNSSSFNIKCHGGRETHIDNKLGSAMANPYVVLAATVAAGLDGIMHNLNVETGPNRTITQQKQFSIPLNLNDALTALEEDHVIHNALGEPFVQYFLAMKRFEIETQELDEERNKCLEYFI